MQRLAAIAAALLAACQFLVSADALHAQERMDADQPSVASTAGAVFGQASTRTMLRQSWVEEWDPAARRWVRVSEVRSGATQGPSVDDPEPAVRPATAIVGPSADRSGPSNRARLGFEQRQSFAVPAVGPKPISGIPGREMIAAYGPFRVTDPQRAVLVGATDAHTPRLFDAMLRDFPALEVIEMVDAPGTDHDIANLALGRRIREAGLATHVPEGGSVRSGAVELFLAGSQRTIEPGARFAVHSWLDSQGREADDFAPNAPAHRMYINYYVEMGLSEQRARDFYAMTNSVPHSSALWLRADEMRAWIAPTRQRRAARTIAALVPPVNLDEPPLALPPAVAQAPVQDFGSVAASPVGQGLPSIDYADLTHTIFAWSGTALRST
ncbi:MAG: hypothetical protein RIC51_01250 [Erythrobacter sp.]|uniref:hypothetical protein n=1 Tax=Erythrobacter sp. TaxID=1042 RepID=UPI0032EB40E9